MATQLDLHVFLAAVDSGEPAFVFEEPRADGDDSPGRGFRGWVQARFRRFKERWLDTGTPPDERNPYAAPLADLATRWLHRASHPDERLLAWLRSARRVEVHHPEGLDAEAAWSAFLAAAWRRHWPRFLGNALLAPFSVLLIPLPGPNVVGFWLAYRTVHHALILVGVNRVRRGRTETVFRHSPPPIPLLPTPEAQYDRPACDCSATTSTRGSAGATDGIGSSASSR